jgi:hypothetical protein
LGAKSRCRRAGRRTGVSVDVVDARIARFLKLQLVITA